jgi:uncharacterized protein YaaN involved in tellurite resistance
MVEQWKKRSVEIDKIYAQMSHFSTWMQKDRDELRYIYERNHRAYLEFLPEYIKAK